MSDTLFNFIDPVLSASVVLLRENGLTVSNIQRGTGSLETPRVELQCTMGNPVGHVHITSPSSSVFDAYEGSLRATVVTNRKENDSYHATYVSKCHNVLSNPASFQNRLANHYILRVRHGGTNQSYLNDRTTDVSTITFDFLIQIKKSAWS